MARCQDMSTLPAGYILQRKVTSASSSGSLGFIVCVQDGWKCTKMANISILVKTVRSCVDCRLDDTTFGVGTFSQQNSLPLFFGISTFLNCLEQLTADPAKQLVFTAYVYYSKSITLLITYIELRGTAIHCFCTMVVIYFGNRPTV